MNKKFLLTLIFIFATFLGNSSTSTADVIGSKLVYHTYAACVRDLNPDACKLAQFYREIVYYDLIERLNELIKVDPCKFIECNIEPVPNVPPVCDPRICDPNNFLANGSIDPNILREKLVNIVDGLEKNIKVLDQFNKLDPTPTPMKF